MCANQIKNRQSSSDNVHDEFLAARRRKNPKAAIFSLPVDMQPGRDLFYQILPGIRKKLHFKANRKPQTMSMIYAGHEEGFLSFGAWILL